MKKPSELEPVPGYGDVVGCLRELSRPLDPVRVDLTEALGRVLREPVLAAEDQPAFDRSAVDGFAVRLDDVADRFRVVDSIRAGEWKPRALNPGEAVRVATGAAVPGAGLQVVMQEHTQPEGNLVAIRERRAERNIRFRGEDTRVGQVLVKPGTVLTAGALALLASVGEVRPLVSRRPRILHLVTGNELVSPGELPGLGQIRDAGSTLVAAFLAGEAEPLEQWRVAEEAPAEAELFARVQAKLDQLDLLLISGGASVGPHDFTRSLLERLGFRLLIRRTATRPGKPLIVAQRGSAMALGLPGNPLAHFVCLHLYARVLLDGMAGRAVASRLRRGRLSEGIEVGRGGWETFWPAHAEPDDDSMRLTPLEWASSGDLTVLARTNALIFLPAEPAWVASDTRVNFIPTSLEL
jgi:molybdopterin molybdotransferase